MCIRCANKKFLTGFLVAVLLHSQLATLMSFAAVAQVFRFKCGTLCHASSCRRQVLWAATWQLATAQTGTKKRKKNTPTSQRVDFACAMSRLKSIVFFFFSGPKHIFPEPQPLRILMPFSYFSINCFRRCWLFGLCPLERTIKAESLISADNRCDNDKSPLAI